jgi:protein SCO1/2
MACARQSADRPANSFSCGDQRADCGESEADWNMAAPLLTKAMTKATRHFLLILSGLALGLAVIGSFAFRDFGGGREGAIGETLAMTAPDGRTVTNADFAGRPFLVFFGYTHCPDVCPATLAQISAAFKSLGADAKIAALFVTVDPERDSPADLKAYLESFDPRIIGLSGDAAQTRAAARAFRVYYRKHGDGSGGYAIDHTGLVYLMDKRGRFVGAFNLDRPAKEAASDLARYL